MESRLLAISDKISRGREARENVELGMVTLDMVGCSNRRSELLAAESLTRWFPRLESPIATPTWVVVVILVLLTRVTTVVRSQR